MAGFRHCIHRIRHGLAFAVVSAAVLACSSKASSSQAGQGDAAPYSNAVCNRFQRCQPALVKSFFGDLATCATRFAADFQIELAQPGVSVTTAQLGDCTNQLSNTGCDAREAELTACRFTGSLAAGAQCASNAQCATGSCFHGIASGTESACGNCTARVPSGGSCKNAACDTDLFCVNDVCTAAVPIGSACDPETTVCAGLSSCVNRRCAAPSGQGAPCDLSVGTGCDSTQGLTCTLKDLQSSTGTCEVARYANLNDTCGIDQTGKITNCLGSSCSRVPNGKCIPDLKEGAACPDPTKPPSQDTDQAQCEFPLECFGGKCTRLVSTKCQ